MLLAAGCTKGGSNGAAAPPTETAASALTPTARAERSASPSEVDRSSRRDSSDPEPAAGLRVLAVPEFTPALLFSPSGSDARPLIVAAHGAGGSPEWECEYWRRLSRERAFVVCLRGTSLGSGGGYYFRDHHALEREFVAAEAAARRTEPRIAPGSGLYAGFSQGATMGTAMIAAHASAFPYLVLIEGFELWNVPRARQFALLGGKRVLIACGSKECAKVGAQSVRWLARGGVEARLEFERGAGHTPLEGVMDRVDNALPWLLDDDLWR